MELIALRACRRSCACVDVLQALIRMLFMLTRTQRRECQGSGTLFLTTENITWLNAADAGGETGKTLSFHWRSILMHAISRDTSSFPHPCIYCQVLARPAGDALLYDHACFSCAIAALCSYI